MEESAPAEAVVEPAVEAAVAADPVMIPFNTRLMIRVPSAIQVDGSIVCQWLPNDILSCAVAGE